MRNTILAGISFLFLFSSCRQNNDTAPRGFYQKQNSAVYKDSLTLKEDGQVAFPLDKVTPLTSNSIQLFEAKDGKRYFSIYNFFNTAVYVYDYDTKTLVKKISMYKEGPNGIGSPDYIAHYMISKDSLVISNQWNNRIFILNDSGKVISKFQFPMPGSNKAVAVADAKTSKPMQFIDKKLYVIGNLVDLNIEDQTRIKNVLTVNLSNKSTGRFFNRSALYNEGTFGGFQYDLFGTYNSTGNSFAYSYAADPFVYETDLAGNIRKKTYLSSKYFEEILPFSAKRYKNDNVDVPKLEKHDHIVPRYGKLIYDPFRKIYLRFTILPMSNEDYNDPKKRDFQQESIIISDEKFRKIGEVLLPKKRFKTDMCFVAKEGFFMALLPELQENEDRLVFVNLKTTKV
jgi:hypothetical protein